MTDPIVLLDIKDRIATVTLNDPDRRNPITGNNMIEAMLDVFDQVQRNPDVSVMVLTGAGSAFCAGGDIKAMHNKTDQFGLPPLDVAESYINGIQRIPIALYNLDVPTIAAVNGAAVGAGCDLTMMCDMRIASEKAKFGEVFLNLGIIPGDAGSWFLIRRLGYQMAAELTFSARMIDAAEALDLDMVIEVVPHNDLMARARAKAAVIAAKPPRTVRTAKRLLRNAERMDLPDFLNTAAAYQALMHQTGDHHEALSAFLEKRQPTYSGK